MRILMPEMVVPRTVKLLRAPPSGVGPAKRSREMLQAIQVSTHGDVALKFDTRSASLDLLGKVYTLCTATTPFIFREPRPVIEYPGATLLTSLQGSSNFLGAFLITFRVFAPDDSLLYSQHEECGRSFEGARPRLVNKNWTDGNDREGPGLDIS
jgi:hypothetical protein